jgi:hypothetical protein
LERVTTMKELKFTPKQVQEKLRHNSELIDKIVELENDLEIKGFVQKLREESTFFNGLYIFEQEGHMSPKFSGPESSLRIYGDFQLRNIPSDSLYKSLDDCISLTSKNTSFLLKRSQDIRYEKEMYGQEEFKFSNGVNNSVLSREGSTVIAVYGKNFKYNLPTEILENISKNCEFLGGSKLSEDGKELVYKFTNEAIGKNIKLKIMYEGDIRDRPFLKFDINLDLKKGLGPGELPESFKKGYTTDALYSSTQNSRDFLSDAKKLIEFGKKKL